MEVIRMKVTMDDGGDYGGKYNADDKDYQGSAMLSTGEARVPGS